MRHSMLSVIIAAHNEESVLGPTLDALLDQPGTRDAQVIVSANGCTDRTADVAAARGVVVVDRLEPGKAGALNAADAIATGSARMYLDADIVLPPEAATHLLGHLGGPQKPLAVVPRRRVNTSASGPLVKAYYAINGRLPVFRRGLFGRGLILLSQEGRGRFGAFPAMIADDLYVDAQFTDEERVEAHDVEVVIEAPRDTRSLVRRLIRVRRGNAQMRAAGAVEGDVHAGVRRSDKWSWLRDVVAAEPRLFPAGLVYCAITLLASLMARRAPRGDGWAQDRSTRVPDPGALPGAT
ncbi:MULTISPECIES: glycosyltransferase [unclassified Microbacterium]|uniref:glycosyltransferase n=1 Tax=unclassified Microbacterium TaxID=2609290 RepID=UPI00214C0544|nr:MULTISPECIES: glycosyltransferase [unclassified Microbacterium]MCR2785010.1 glycosyltransferase [Microbacterium sp. zg.B96]WIM16549.1 glycosyltransferase [Microbacterium sp. zg-B96]